MFIKPISILVLVLLILSCGSSKQIASTIKTENTIQKKEQKKVKNDSLEIKESKTIKADSIIYNVTTTTNDSVYFINIVSHDKWNTLLKKHVSEDGNVNYKGFLQDKSELKSYISELTENLPQDNWKKNHKLAYWINAYNALTVDLIIRNYPLQSIKDLKDPWDQRLWKFGSKWYNLNDIEHQILRKMEEPRIHFAIVCASVSCPKLQNFAFDNWKLNDQLDKATKAFLLDTSKNNISENNLKLSKIFKWFSKDFKTNETSLIDFLNQYSDITISDKAKKNYKDYNWNLNE